MKNNFAESRPKSDWRVVEDVPIEWAIPDARSERLYMPYKNCPTDDQRECGNLTYDATADEPDDVSY